MELAELGKQPIRPEQPAGDDVRYDPQYEELQAEVDKLSSLTASGGIDWGKVVRLSSGILSSKSKDLLVASYLAVGLVYEKKVDGLESGLRLFSDLIANFWETMYPAKARMRGRVGAVTWWIEKAEVAVRSFPETQLPADRLSAILESLEGIDRFLGENMEDGPSLRPLRDAMETVLVAREEPPPPPPPKASESAAASGPGEGKATKAGEGSVSVPTKVSSESDASEALEAGLSLIEKVSDYLRGARLSDPAHYRLARTAAWTRIEALPPASDGRTEIPPPPDFVRDPILAMREGAGGENLVRIAEEAVTRSIFWLDLHRISAEALGGLGEEYSAAMGQLCGETALFVRRLQGIEELSFSDGTPFADEATRQWLKGIAAGGGGTVAAGAGSRVEEAAAAAARSAKILVEEGNLKAAIGPLQQGIRTGASQREKMVWRLALSRLMVETGNGALALPHLEQALNDIEAYRLEEYDPAVALQGLRLAWLEMRKRGERIEDGKDNELLKRIARLDLAEAVRIQEG
ncbi:MAG: type VI secretion system protein TssA [Deltaproteobacteria bacterium]|nr:type VI secretion system protein TssA [Deltaproteobacteria bacterium]